MICSEAIADAEMDFALSADEVSLLALACSVAALSAVALLRETHRVMILSQCCTSRGRVRCTLRPSIGRQALHELVSELHAEGEVRFFGVLHLPQPERIENADVDQPPHQARPALTALPAWQVGVVQLIDDIHSAGVMEVVADGLRAAELVDGAIVSPALHRSELLGINVIVQQQDELLVAPGT